MALDRNTSKHAIQFRVYVGPRFLPASEPAFWDWSGLVLGAAYTPAPAATTLASGMTSASTSAVLTDASSFPSAGACWIGSGAAGESWEYVTWTGKSSNTLTGLTRETADAELTGDHTAGAEVRFWWHVQNTDPALSLQEQMDATLSAVGWTASMSGHTFRQAAMRNHHLVLVQRRSIADSEADWSDWTNALIGWIDRPNAKDNAAKERNWTLQVIASDGLLSVQEIDGVHVGPIELATQGDATASSELSEARKERHSGEFSQASPTFEAGNATDGDAATLWMSERFVGSDNLPTTETGLDQIHIAQYTGQSRGYRWIQLISRGGTGDEGFHLLNDERYFPWFGTKWEKFDPFPESGKPMMICENRRLFEEENPDCDCPIFEVSDDTTEMYHMRDETKYATWDAAPGMTVTEWWDSLDPDGGALYCIYWSSWLPEPQGTAVWGSMAAAGHDFFGFDWSGASLDAVADGQTIRRIWANPGNAASGWSVGYPSMPGYLVEAANRQWLRIEIPTMDLVLHDDITDSSPGTGETLYIDGPNGASTDGLDASGTIQIGDEQITYSAKVDGGVTVTARGANSTTPAAHSADDTIYQVDGGVAVDVPPTAKVTVTVDADTPVPEDFIIRGARYSSVRMPEDEDYETDWTTLATVTSNALSTYELTLGTPARYRFILLEVSAMSTDPYRVAINEVSVESDANAYDEDLYLDGVTAGEVIEQLFLNAGLPAGAITVEAGTPSVTGVTTEKGNAWSIAVDLAEMTGCRITVGRDSQVTIEVDPYWSIAGVPAEEMNWTRVQASEFDPDFGNGRNVAQIELEWKTLANAAGGVARYPSTPDPVGAVVRDGPLMYANETAALAAAQKRYWQRRRPYGGMLQAAGAPIDVRPGEVHGVLWELDEQMLELDRSYLFIAASHDIADGAVTSVFQVLQVSRTDER